VTAPSAWGWFWIGYAVVYLALAGWLDYAGSKRYGIGAWGKWSPEAGICVYFLSMIWPVSLLGWVVYRLKTGRWCE